MSSEAIMVLSGVQQEPGNFLAVPIAHIHWVHNPGHKPTIAVAVDMVQD